MFLIAQESNPVNSEDVVPASYFTKTAKFPKTFWILHTIYSWILGGIKVNVLALQPIKYLSGQLPLTANIAGG